MQIKKIIQLGAIAAVAVGLASCMNQKHYAMAVQSWHGAPESALIKDWGEPTNVKMLANGNRLYTYHIAQTQDYPKVYSPGVGSTRTTPQNNDTQVLSEPSSVPRASEATFWCDTQFEINKTDLIVSTNFHGNNCVASLASAYRREFAH